MGILDKWVTNKLIKNKGVLYDIMDYRFNQGLVEQRNQTSPEHIFTRTLLENNKWNSGIVEELEWFYKNTYPKLIGYNSTPVISYFWYKVTPKTMRVHSGVPGLISKTMINLIAAPGFDVSVNLNGEYDEEQTYRLLDILKENNFENKLLPDGVNAESYGGYFAYKISQDDTISDKPIIELVAPENVEVITERGRLKGFIFKTNFKEGNDNYELHEIYTKNGDSTLITYKKFKYVNAKIKEVPLSREEDEKYQDIEIKGLDIPAILKNNTATNTQFKNSYYGLSDYNNSQSIFNSLDEVLSQMVTAIRFARPKRFISEDLLVNNFTGSKAEFDDFETDYELVQSDPDSESGTYKQFDSKLDVTVYTEAFKSLLVQALNNSGLSPASVGVTGLEALNASEGTQREKEKTTLRTRELKLGLWQSALKELFGKLLKFDDVVNGNGVSNDYEVAITFNDYAIPSMEQRIETAGKALNQGLIDVYKAVDLLFMDDMTEEEKMLMVKNIKTENGVPLVEDDIATTTRNTE